MAQTVKIKQGDLFPDITTEVKDEAGAVVDLTGASCKFSMRASRGGALVINQVAGQLVNGPTGKLGYAWISGDTDTPGTYEAEFLVNPASGDDFRVPTEGVITVIIEEQVA